MALAVSGATASYAQKIGVQRGGSGSSGMSDGQSLLLGVLVIGLISYFVLHNTGGGKTSLSTQGKAPTGADNPYVPKRGKILQRF